MMENMEAKVEVSSLYHLLRLYHITQELVALRVCGLLTEVFRLSDTIFIGIELRKTGAISTLTKVYTCRYLFQVLYLCVSFFSSFKCIVLSLS